MGLSDFFLEILYWRIVPSLTTVLLTYGFLLLAARLLGIRQSKWLYWLFAVPLVKGLAVLVVGAQGPSPVPTTKPFMLGVRLWNPLQLPGVPGVEKPPPLFDSFAVMLIVLVLMAALAGALFLRWASLVAFYRSLGSGERLTHRDAPRVFRALDKLVPRIGARYPEVAVSDCGYLLPCTIGVRHPVILLPPEMVEESTDEVLEAVLAHELAHIKRGDNVFHWALLLLRDLLFFNPAAHYVFARIMLAKEKACDSIAARVIEKPAALGQAIYEAASLAVSRKLVPLPGNLSGLSSPFRRAGNAKERIISLNSPRPEAPRVSPIAIAILIFWVLIALLLNIYVSGPFPKLYPVLQF